MFKAPQRGLGQYQNDNGYLAQDFPGGGPDDYFDGRAYFAKGDDTIAQKYAASYGEGIMEVRIPADDYAELFQRYEYPYEGGPLTEVAIPNTDVEQLNDYPRTWHR